MLFLGSQQTSSSRRRAPPPEIYVPPHSGAGDDPFLGRWNVSQATFAPIPPNGKSSSSNKPPPLSDNGRQTPSNGTQQPSNGRYQPWPAQSNFTSDTDEYPLTTATPGISVLPPVRFFSSPSTPQVYIKTDPNATHRPQCSRKSTHYRRQRQGRTI